MRCCSMRVSGLGGSTSSLRGRPRLRLGGAGERSSDDRRRGFLAGFDLGGIARDMTDDVIVQMTADELLMHTFRQTLCGELGKGAREGCLAGNLGAAFPAADASQCTIELQTLDQGLCGGDGEHGLGDEAAGDGGGGHPVARPRPRAWSATKASSPSVSRTIMRCSSLVVRGSSSSSSPGSRLRWRLIQVP